MLLEVAGGLDFGNENTEVVLFYKGRKVSITLPSAIALGTLEGLSRIRSVADTEVLKDREYVLQIGNDAQMYVGELALTQSADGSTWKGDIGRYWSDRPRALLLVAAGSLIEERDFCLTMVTGLPVHVYLQDESHRQRMRQALQGDYEFVLNGRRRCASIRVGRVIMEGAGALIAYGRSEAVRQGVIDIGYYSTDLYAAVGQEPLRHLCAGKPLGISQAAQEMNRLFEEDYLRPLSASEQRSILFAHAGASPYPRLFVDGCEVAAVRDVPASLSPTGKARRSLHTLAETALRRVGRDIAAFVSSAWNEGGTGKVASGFALVLRSGGGAYQIEEIQTLIQHARMSSAPHEDNALGYAALAERLRQQGI